MSNDVISWLVIGSCFGALFFMWALSFLRGNKYQKKIIKAAEDNDIEALKMLIAQDKLIDNQRDFTYKKCIEIAHERKYSDMLRYLLETNVFPLSWEERFGNWVLRLREKNKFWYAFAYIFSREIHHQGSMGSHPAFIRSKSSYQACRQATHVFRNLPFLMHRFAKRCLAPFLT